MKRKSVIIEPEELVSVREGRIRDSSCFMGSCNLPKAMKVACPCCGSKRKVLQAELYQAVESQTTADWIVTCPDCGMRCGMEPYIASEKPDSEYGKIRKVLSLLLAAGVLAIAILAIFAFAMAVQLLRDNIDYPVDQPVEQRDGPHYQLYMGDFSWEDACEYCAEKGGHLAYITTQDEYEEIVSMIENAMTLYDMPIGTDDTPNSLYYVWLGAENLNGCQQEENDFHWLDDTYFSDMENHLWWSLERADGSVVYEPSFTDQGQQEPYLCLWAAHYGEHFQDDVLGWTFNDQSNDIVSASKSAAGRIGFICEWDEYSFEYNEEKASCVFWLKK